MGITLKFVSENAGISKKSGKPYHMIKFADPDTYENHTVSVHPSVQGTLFNFAPGQVVEVEGRLATPFDHTQYVVTNVKAVQHSK